MPHPLKKGTLSVVVINYNHGHYIGEALQAILDQSYRPLEVIVIDDASTDNSVEIIEGFARKDPIVRLYRNEQNQGSIFGVNRGLDLAAGEYINMAASDDRICPGLYEKSMELLAQYPEAGMCSALVRLIDAHGNDKGWIETPVISQAPCFLPPEKAIATLVKYGHWHTGQTVIMRRDAVLQAAGRYRPDLFHHTDQFLFLVVALKFGACFIPEILATWRVLDTGYAETMFNNVEISRTAFEKVTRLMRSPEYVALFPEKFTKVWERRGWYSIEARHYRRLVERNQLDFLGRLRELRRRPTLLDKTFFAALKLLALAHGLVAKTYLWHRRINWDLPWLICKVRLVLRRNSSGGRPW
jgi:glycosyltransferase involved in cell wall biosynthesis